MAFLYNYPVESKISDRMFDFFCSEVLYALSKPKDQHLWIVTPWIRDSQFSTYSRGNISHLFPQSSGTFIMLSDILKRLLELGVKITLVCLPPHKLLNLQCYSNYIEIEKNLQDILDNNKGILRLLNEFAEPTVEVGYSLREIKEREEKIIKIATQRCNSEMDYEKFRSMQHLDMFEFLKNLQNAPGSEHLELVYNESLHAKIIVGKFGGFFGSANITYSGLNKNDELFAYITDESDLYQLKEGARSFSEKSKEKYGVSSSDKYSPISAFTKASSISEYQLNEWLNYPFPEEMLLMLEICGLPVSPLARPPMFVQIEEPLFIDTETAPQNRPREHANEDIIELPLPKPMRELSENEWEKISEYDDKYKAVINLYLKDPDNYDLVKNDLEKAYKSAIQKGLRYD